MQPAESSQHAQPLQLSHASRYNTPTHRALGRPFVKKAATDEFKLLGSVESVLRAVGKVFDEGTPTELQLEAAEVRVAGRTANPQAPALPSSAGGGQGRQ